MELLERTAFLKTLAEYAAEARQGNGRLVLVSGESGMGKTVLLEAFQQRLPGARWLWGGCDHARRAAGGRDLDETFFHSYRGAQMSVRWVYVHMIQECARHNGHADLLRARIDGATGR